MKLKNRLISIILSVTLVLSVLTVFGGCANKRTYKTDVMHIGFGGIPAEIYGGARETCLTEEYLVDINPAFGGDSTRINMSFGNLFKTSVSSDEISFNQVTLDKLHSYLDKLYERGITRIVALTDNYLYPYDYGYSIPMCVPNPLTEEDFYIRWLKINAKAWEMIAKEFPYIRYFEPTNEPDHYKGTALNQNGFTYGGTDNADFMWSYEEAGYIIADMCYYLTKAVKSVNPENRVMTPGLTALVESPDYLRCIYNAIKSQTLPTGYDYADVNPDNYFEILNWHPYILKEGCSSVEEWKQFQIDFYNVCKEYGDGNTPVWFTEMGFTDEGLGDKVEQECAEKMIKLLNYSKELGFVDTVLVWCLSNRYDTKDSASEDNFGLIRSLAEPERGGEIKPIGEAVFKFINGENADITPLRNLANKHYKLFQNITE
ncbi:MAG: hypothetical protein E7369_05755 [Clostridiales bacterium]|nr:hypothetical protein [Clostridiales bacterium]